VPINAHLDWGDSLILW